MTEITKNSLAIVIPTTGRKTLDEALESIFKQSVLPDEIIVFDNSGCNTVKKDSKWKNHPNVQWFYSDRKKDIISSWNTAVSLVNTNYAYVLGDDDYLLPDFVFTVKKHLQQGCDMLYVPPLYWLKNGQLVDPTATVKLKGEKNNDEFINTLLCDMTLPVYLGTIVFSTAVFKKIKGYKSIITNALAMDHLFHLENAKESHHIFAVEKPLWKYRCEVDDWNGRITDLRKVLKLGLQFKKFFTVIKKISPQDVEAEKLFYKKYLTTMIQIAFSQHFSPLRDFVSFLICLYPYHSVFDNIYLLRSWFYLFRKRFAKHK